MQDLTTGSITRHLLKTASFMLVTMVFQTLYFLVDLYWVGRLGKEAVAAVGVAGNLTFIVLAISQMLGVGTTTLVSHAAGRKDHDRALLVFNQSQVLSMLVGAVFFVVAMLLQRSVRQRCWAPTRRRRGWPSDYLLWFIPAMALQFAMVAMGAALRGTGNFKPGMIVQTATVIINIVLAPILIFGWGTGVPMGVAGAAIATLVAVVVGVVWLATLLHRSRLRTCSFCRRDWTPQFTLWGEMLKIGLPAGAEFALMAVYLFVVYTISRPFGAAAQAGFGIGMRVVQAGVHAGRRARVRGRAGRRPELRRPAGRIASQDALHGRGDGRRAHVRCGRLSATSRRRRWCASSPTTPEVIAVGDEYLRIISWNFVASGTRLRVPRACSRRWATRSRRWWRRSAAC